MILLRHSGGNLRLPQEAEVPARPCRHIRHPPRVHDLSVRIPERNPRQILRQNLLHFNIIPSPLRLIRHRSSLRQQSIHPRIRVSPPVTTLRRHPVRPIRIAKNYRILIAPNPSQVDEEVHRHIRIKGPKLRRPYLQIDPPRAPVAASPAPAALSSHPYSSLA